MTASTENHDSSESETGMVDLPDNVILKTADSVTSQSDLSSLSQTNQHLNDLPTPELCARDAQAQHPGFLHAVFHENLPSIRKFLAHGGIDLDTYFGKKRWIWQGGDAEHGTTALAHAVERRNGEMIQLLVDHGANVMADDGKALMLAAAHGDAEMVKKFLDLGADANHREYAGKGYALAYAIDSDSLDALKVMKLLLDAGADPNAAGPSGLTPLMRGLVRKEAVAITRLLLSFGADPNVVDSAGRTPIMWCIRDSKLKILKALLDAGARLEQADITDNTSYDYAKLYKKADVLEVLKKAGARSPDPVPESEE